MKILLAPNYFKGSLSALKAAQIMEKTILEVINDCEIITLPIADGGDGTLEAIKACTNAESHYIKVKNPLGKPVNAEWILLKKDNKKIALIESAQANGLSLLDPSDYNPLKTTTYGVGELVINALRCQCDEIIVTVGGSSTNDAGAGLLQALGVNLLAENNTNIGFGGGELGRISKIDLSCMLDYLQDVKFKVACDVDNPLYGPYGASMVYGAQKGASLKDIEVLDQNLKHFSELTKQLLGKDYSDLPGTGAAGGIGFAMKAFLKADIIKGFDLVRELTSFESSLKGCKFVVTTEGRFDSQSLSGKAPLQVAKLASKYDVPTIVIAGSVERNLNLIENNVIAAFSLADGPLSLDDSISNIEYLLQNITTQVFNLLKHS